MQCWGIPQPEPFALVGRSLLLVVDKEGVPLEIMPNPVWVPKELIGDD